MSSNSFGKVYLVGAGPGDKGLITVKGLDAIKKADVILYDHLVSESLLEEARDDAELIYVGKTIGDHHLRQEKINELLKEHVKLGKIVVRLKGGDPFVFGRGGEEALELHRAKIAFEVIPGVSSAIAVPAYAGIPLTQRQVSSSVAIVAGHEDPTKKVSSVDWACLAGAVDTLVILMGLTQLGSIVGKLLAAGKNADTPVALVRCGTRREQQTVTGRLDEIVGLAASHRFEPPAIIIVGEVVRLREELSWFETRPLFGRKIAVVRDGEAANSLGRALKDAGAQVLDVPEGAQNSIVRELTAGRIDTITFVSASSISCFIRDLNDSHLQLPGGVTLACVGTETAGAARRLVPSADIILENHTVDGLIEDIVSSQHR